MVDKVAENALDPEEQLVEVKENYRGYRVANVISHLFNPSITGSAFMITMLLMDGGNLMESFRWLLILLGINLVPIGILTAYLLRKNKIDTIFIKTRQKRTLIYLLSSVLTGLSCVIMLIFDAPVIILAATTVILLINILFMCVNFFWKISVHAAYMSLALCALIVSCGTLAFSSLLLLPLVSWARIKLGFHTPTQVIGGTVAAVLVFITVVNLFGII
jgi:membrane-associated phospholipid phosphatase